MKVITEREQIRTVAERWRMRYRCYPDDKRIAGFNAVEIGRQLAALDPETATAAVVAKIVGNDSWTRVPPCTECGREDAPAVIEVGDPRDYESAMARLCPDCVRRAFWKLLPEAP